MTTKINSEERVQKAVELYNNGYSCSQSVVLAFTDIFNINEEVAMNFSAGFGSGIGGLREVCGAASGMFMLLGWMYPYGLGEIAKRKECYTHIKECANKFKERMGGSYLCGEILKTKVEDRKPVPTDEIINKYAQKSCQRSVANAALIICEEINGKEE